MRFLFPSKQKRPEPLPISMSTAKYHGTYKVPAVLSEEAVRSLLAILPMHVREGCAESARDAAKRLLVQNANEPTDIPRSHTDSINQKIEERMFDGKYFRLARDHGKAQLWEVEPPTAH